MLLGMGGSRAMRFLARTGYHEDLNADLSECVYAGIAVSLFSIAGLFMGIWMYSGRFGYHWQ